MPLAGAGDLDHGEAVRGGVGKRHQPVEEPRSGHCQADARLLCEEPRRRRRVAGVALVTEADVADARCLGDASQVGDRNADDPVDDVHVVELERVDDQMDAIGESTRIAGCACLRVLHGSDGHGEDPSWLFAISLTLHHFPASSVRVSKTCCEPADKRELSIGAMSFRAIAKARQRMLRSATRSWRFSSKPSSSGVPAATFRNALAATEPGAAAWMAIEIFAVVSGSTRRTALALPVTDIAPSQVCGTTLTRAPVATCA